MTATERLVVHINCDELDLRDLELFSKGFRKLFDSYCKEKGVRFSQGRNPYRLKIIEISRETIVLALFCIKNLSDVVISLADLIKYIIERKSDNNNHEDPQRPIKEQEDQVKKYGHITINIDGDNNNVTIDESILK